MMAAMDMPMIFMALMGLSVLAYVVLDGYDLGVGMLMPAATEEEQSVMVASIGPFWDANETWLVLGIGILLAAFPVAHGVVLGALYLPVVAMLVGLMLRGVAFELRMKALGWHRELWNWLFWAGSFVASFFQGVMLGRYVTGFEPGFGYWLFALVVGASLCGGYVLLGATWLVMKTEGTLQKKSVAWARWGLLWVGLGVALVSLGTPLVSATVREKWFDFPRTLWLMILPAATVAIAWVLWRSLAAVKAGTTQRDARPFIAAAAIFTLAFAGLAYSLS
ncbi:MAG TPA: cytochrome d ubiquinol oxidase subunit II, partial [Usitatibacter sp.]|nr:cytochrome d ubiquinol oxidase subunit II [Usitatibacter sp.]